MAEAIRLTSIFIGAGAGGAKPQQLELKRANRHGLIAGATGTGKTVTLQGIIEGLVGGRRPDLRRRCEGRPCRPRHARRRNGQAARGVYGPRRGNRLFRLVLRRLSGPVLGSVRGTGPSGPNHRQRNGAAAAGAADEPQRCAGRRADHRLPRRRQGGADAPRPRRSAGDAGQYRRAGRRPDARIWQCVEA